MFVIRWIRQGAALPILWAAQLALMLKLPVAPTLLKAAWAVGKAPEVGHLALSAIRRLQGRDAARALAETWIEESPNAPVAAFAGFMAAETGELEAAQQFLERGRSLPEDPNGALDWLEYVLADGRGEAQAAAQRLEQRNDLPPELSNAVLTQLMFNALLRGDVDEAGRRADRLLAVADNAPAEMVGWALAKRAGNEAQAAAHLARAGLPPAQELYYQFLGCCGIGAMAEAVGIVADIRQHDAGLAERAEGILKAKEAARCP